MDYVVQVIGGSQEGEYSSTSATDSEAGSAKLFRQKCETVGEGGFFDLISNQRSNEIFEMGKRAQVSGEAERMPGGVTTFETYRFSDWVKSDPTLFEVRFYCAGSGVHILDSDVDVTGDVYAALSRLSVATPKQVNKGNLSYKKFFVSTEKLKEFVDFAKENDITLKRVNS